MNTLSSLRLKLKTVQTMNQEAQMDQLVESEQEDFEELKDELHELAEKYIDEVNFDVLKRVMNSSDWILSVSPLVTDDELRETAKCHLSENLIFMFDGMEYLIKEATT